MCSRPDMTNVSRAPKESEIDMVFMGIFVALALAAFSIWLVWSNWHAAATWHMLGRSHVMVQGVEFVEKVQPLFEQESKEVQVAYGFKDNNGKVWIRVQTSPYSGLSEGMIHDSVFQGIKSTLEGKTAKRVKFSKNGVFRKIDVAFHPEYPRFFANKGEWPRLEFNFHLAIAALVGLLLCVIGMIVMIRKYRYYKAVQAYY